MQVDILGGLTQNIFAYDAMQNRIKKRKVVSGSDISTFYIRDAQGNVLAVYEKNGTTITWKEQHLYGSSRLGTVEPGVAWTSAPAATPYFRTTRILNYGWKRYEVNDHLGNVRALINDRKTYGGATFTATLLDATDYFPFGAEMRKATTATNYRFGFNGKELDKTEFGSLNHYDYGFRIYNPGIGRFLSVDPLTGDYPELTPYQFAGNTPIQAVDLDGLEPKYFIDDGGKLTKPLVALIKNSFNFSKSSLSSSIWQPYNLSISITGRDGKPFNYYPNMAWALMVGIPASTSASVKGHIVVHDDDQNRSDAEWLDLIIHEQSHQEDMEGSTTGFYLDYIFEGMLLPYSEISTEKKAFSFSPLVDQLLYYSNATPIYGFFSGKLSDFFGGEVLGTLSNNSLSENQKTSILATLGAKFRRDVLLAGRLQAIDSELNSIRIKMLDNSIVEKPRYELDEMYKQQKNMLKNERKSILAEQKEITKKHGK